MAWLIVMLPALESPTLIVPDVTVANSALDRLRFPAATAVDPRLMGVPAVWVRKETVLVPAAMLEPAPSLTVSDVIVIEPLPVLCSEAPLRIKKASSLNGVPGSAVTDSAPSTTATFVFAPSRNTPLVAGAAPPVP